MILLALLILTGLSPSDPDPKPAPDREPTSTRPLLTVRAVHPDQELVALLHLFEGSRAHSPAAALAAWKRAAPNPRRLGKPVEAIIATGNPLMVPEFRSLDDARVGLRRDPGSGRWLWRATLPHDDGPINAVAATTALSGGRVGPGVPGVAGDSPIFYLSSGPAPLLTRVGSTLALSNDPTQLAVAVREVQHPAPAPPPPFPAGWIVQVDPREVADQFPTLAGRRVDAILQARRWFATEGRLRIDGPTLVATTLGTSAGPLPSLAPLDPAWVAVVPARGVLAAWAVRIDARPEAIAHLFECVDRVERLDPARAQVGPSRFRLALLLRAAGVRLDGDLLPHLAGLAGWVGPEGADLIGQGVVACHLDDAAVAQRIVAGVRATRAQVAPPGTDGSVALGRVAGRPLTLLQHGRAVVLAWGDRAWATALEAQDHPERSAGRWLAASRSGFAPSRSGAVWLDQALRLVPSAGDLAASFAGGPPLRWAGQTTTSPAAETSPPMGLDHDEVWLDDLSGTVRRFLERLPFDPPPDH